MTDITHCNSSDAAVASPQRDFAWRRVVDKRGGANLLPVLAAPESDLEESGQRDCWSANIRVGHPVLNARWLKIKIHRSRVYVDLKLY
ncbi:unannotated protein [freshwater metagenome]|uniref:Unannotated protein n=1 Tax=freshwater metagenome TaxID=449393 RepID=A0A6J6WP75_9ZZZZ